MECEFDSFLIEVLLGIVDVAARKSKRFILPCFMKEPKMMRICGMFGLFCRPLVVAVIVDVVRVDELGEIPYLVCKVAAVSVHPIGRAILTPCIHESFG
jgi:hypothetical protein